MFNQLNLNNHQWNEYLFYVVWVSIAKRNTKSPNSPIRLCR
ncbi:hypothetical protein PROSTU_02470 [Providencia stuartii ATCC 25827]|uniref:Uncharacterized protein n=1 Tax=Providencia stuartii ATCC 25827 TaxID=471874 RepID=A0AA87CQU6_PROST|nr:hypothetical protein PROSTU_02470 [Providencia stuartii ATCC 25827]